MFKTIDDIMYITDGINPYGLGLGYKPTKYNMIGGTLTNELNIIGLDITELEKMTDEELKNQYDENLVLLKEMENLNLTDEGLHEKKILENETNHILDILNTDIDTDEYDFFQSDEFKEQMKWYEDNLDTLEEDELFVYIQSLAKLKEIENNEKGVSKEITDLDKKLYKAIKDYENITGKEIEYQYEDEEDYEKALDEWYLPELKPEKFENEFIIKLRNLGYSFTNIGNLCEKFYGSKKELFEHINRNTDKSKIINSSITSNNDYYSPNMKIIGDNEILVKGIKMKKSDFYLVDFVSDKNLYEMKALEKSFEDFYKKGSIHLVGTKVSENVNFVGKFTYDKNSNKVVVKNIGYRDYINKPIKFDTLVGNNYNYNVIYCLKDGIYYCNLSNPNLWNIDKNNKATFKYHSDSYGNVHIPIKYVQRIDKTIVEQLNK